MVMVLIVAGCKHPSTFWRSEEFLLANAEHVLISDIPSARSGGPMGCGAKALSSAMCALDPSLDVEVECASLPWHETGATPVDILVAARSRGFAASIHRGSMEFLKQTLSNDAFSLVLFEGSIEAWTPFGVLRQHGERFHWAVVSGVSTSGSDVLLLSGPGRHHVVPTEEFIPRWERAASCTIVVRRGEE